MSEDRQAQLRKAALRFRGIVSGISDDGSIPERDTAIELMAWQSLEADLLEAHTEWLSRVKARCEKSGREWTRENFLRIVQLREHE